MRQDTNEHAIVLFPDRKRLLMNCLPSLPTMLSVIPIVRVWRSGKRVQQIVAVLSAAFLLFWESLYVPLWFRLFFQRPIVVVNEEGIAYTPPSAWFVNFANKIRWEEIAAMFPVRMTKAYSLAIVPKDIETFIQQQKILRPRRFPILTLMRPVGTPFLIPEPTILPFTLNELLPQIQAKYQGKLQANAIEIGEERKITFKTGQ